MALYESQGGNEKLRGVYGLEKKTGRAAGRPTGVEDEGHANCRKGGGPALLSLPQSDINSAPLHRRLDNHAVGVFGASINRLMECQSSQWPYSSDDVRRLSI
ncbi:unnamed protein product [Caenorhabditis auriculariae]|uniref:Uncharacterized protein n=1 Tax=Caenorhabditis auriculariae TaxID=2777116 RepID=A0A8S1GQR1_9PELO|nr:unnamed protein product [Caenorhabditis auriculariae]